MVQWYPARGPGGCPLLPDCPGQGGGDPGGQAAGGPCPPPRPRHPRAEPSQGENTGHGRLLHPERRAEQEPEVPLGAVPQGGHPDGPALLRRGCGGPRQDLHDV